MDGPGVRASLRARCSVRSPNDDREPANRTMTSPQVQEFQIGRSKSRHGFLISGLAVLLGLWIAAFGGNAVSGHQWIGLLLVALGAGVGIRAWRAGRRSGAYLRLSDAGIYFHEWGVTVPWAAVADVYQSGSRLQPFITLKIHDPRRFLGSLSEAEARALRGNALWKSPELRIPYNAVEASHDEVIAAIQRRIRNPSHA